MHQPIRLDVSTESGDIDVVVPRARYAIDLKSDTGEAEMTGIVNDNASLRSIRTVSDVGDVTLAGRAA